MRRLGLQAVTAAALLVSGVAAASAGELWRYTDRNGVIHFVDSRQNIPSGYRPTAERVKGAPDRPEPSQATDKKSSTPAADGAAEDKDSAIPNLDKIRERRAKTCRQRLAELGAEIEKYENALERLKKMAKEKAEAEAAEIAPLLGLPGYECHDDQGRMVPVPAGNVPEGVTCEPSRFVTKEPERTRGMAIAEDRLSELRQRRQSLERRCEPILKSASEALAPRE